MGDEQIAIFDQYLAFSRKRYKIGPSYCATPIRKRVIYRMVQFSMTLSKPNFNGTPLFDVEHLRNGRRWRHGYNRILIGTYAVLNL